MIVRLRPRQLLRFRRVLFDVKTNETIQIGNYTIMMKDMVKSRKILRFWQFNE